MCNCDFCIYEVESGHGMGWIALGATGVWFVSLKKSDAFISRGDELRPIARRLFDETLEDIRQVCPTCGSVSWTVRLS